MNLKVIVILIVILICGTFVMKSSLYSMIPDEFGYSFANYQHRMMFAAGLFFDLVAIGVIIFSLRNKK
jgi:hypothetical protein